VDEDVLRRLNWGCGSWIEPGWINADVKDDPGIDISCDIRDGLPLDDGSIDYAVTIHALPEIPYPELVPILSELRRVLKPNGVLRVSVPDLDVSIRAYLRNDAGHFLIPDDDSPSVGGKFAIYLTWYGYTRSLYTAPFLEELLFRAGFRHVRRCRYRETFSAHAGITELDNREAESLFMEAMK
jgi:SAM-dependent methyltransferase